MTQDTEYNQKVTRLKQDFHKQSFVFHRGIERESLRVDGSGKLAKTTHSPALGSKLCHPTITTDFSEAQLELITPVSQSIEETLTTLNDTHRFVYSTLADEVLWSASMPCILRTDDDIPLAQYGNSNLAKLKTAYRNGLGNRYGRSMQTICAVHYNFSFPDSLWQDLARLEQKHNTAAFRTQRYFDVMRNFRRLSWLPIYLFGASPAVCNSFLKGRQHKLSSFDQSTAFLPTATSLRNGNLGYQSDAQSELLNICYNNIENYVTQLANAVTTPYPAYSKIGIQNNGDFLQLNDSIIQSEAEFYTTIRAKCVPPKGTNFLTSLVANGVEYIEIRLLDVNPYQPLGIDQHTMKFLDVLLLYCLLTESPEHDETLCRNVKDNVTRVVQQGRDIDTTLVDQGKSKSVSKWSKEILADLLALAQELDSVHPSVQLEHSIQLQMAKIDDPAKTPSGQILTDMKTQAIPFAQFAMNKSLAHKAHFLDQPLSTNEQAYFQQIANQSLDGQKDIELQSQIAFTEYLKNIQQEYTPLAK
ncbi:MAG: glutamate--cysteine ligase [Pseudomonadales bacterium]|nr:glutamate--cysteine ligase [Pseudomonadales bacterium]